jgi:hypothetical protein
MWRYGFHLHTRFPPVPVETTASTFCPICMESKQCPPKALVTSLYASISQGPRPIFRLTGDDSNDGKMGAMERSKLIIDMARRGSVKIPLSLATHEQALLVTTEVAEAQCVNGHHCIANKKLVQGFPLHRDSPMVLTTYMTPGQLRAWSMHGTPPPQRQACVLCHRYQQTVLFFKVRGNRGRVEVSPGRCFQVFRVLRDQPDGYKTEHLLPLNKSTWEGFCDHSVQFQARYLSWEPLSPSHENKSQTSAENTDNTTKAYAGPWRVNQSPIMWTSPPPRTQRMQHPPKKLFSSCQ